MLAQRLVYRQAATPATSCFRPTLLHTRLEPWVFGIAGVAFRTGFGVQPTNRPDSTHRRSSSSKRFRNVAELPHRIPGFRALRTRPNPMRVPEILTTSFPEIMATLWAVIFGSVSSCRPGAMGFPAARNEAWDTPAVSQRSTSWSSRFDPRRTHRPRYGSMACRRIQSA